MSVRRILMTAAACASAAWVPSLVAQNAVARAGIVVGSRGHQVNVHPFVAVEESLYEGWHVVHFSSPVDQNSFQVFPTRVKMQGVPADNTVQAGNAFGEEPATVASAAGMGITGFHGERFASSRSGHVYGRSALGGVHDPRRHDRFSDRGRAV